MTDQDLASERRRFGTDPMNPLMIGRLQIELWEQWSEWFTRGWNWRNFDFIKLEYELEHYCEGHEVGVSLLGFCARFTYWYNKDFWKNQKEKPASGEGPAHE